MISERDIRKISGTWKEKSEHGGFNYRAKVKIT